MFIMIILSSSEYNVECIATMLTAQLNESQLNFLIKTWLIYHYRIYDNASISVVFD